LAVFHECILARRKGNLEKLMVSPTQTRHVELCAELENLPTLKEALLLFRNLMQNTNPASLQTVLDRLRVKAEDKVSRLVGKSTDGVDVIDLELEEPPENILLNSVKAAPDKHHQQILSSMRFLWDVYKLSLNILKTNGKMVAAYKDSALSAINFCEKYKRQSECRKLSEILRLHLQNIYKMKNSQTTSTLTYMMKLDEETVSNLIPIRERLMDVCMKLGLWQEAFRAAEDTRLLICEGKPAPFTLARYWNGLARLFWRAGQNLFHAYALYLYYYQNKKHNKKFTGDALIASTIVLSTLAVPTFKLGNDISGVGVEGIFSVEVKKKLANMLIQTAIITREQLVELLHTNNLLELASREVRELFNLLENSFLPLTLSHLVKPLLVQIQEQQDFKMYIPAIEQLLVGRVLAQLSKCYKSLRFETLLKLIDFIPAERLEKYILEISLKTSLRIRIDQSGGAIFFEDVIDEDEKEHRLQRAKELVVQAHRVISEEQDRGCRKLVIANAFGNIEEVVAKSYELRLSMIDDGKRLTKERDETIRKQEEEDKKTREAVQKVVAEEMKVREKTQKLATGLNNIERERRNIKLSIIQSIIEKMKTIGFSSKEMSFQGKKIEKMTDEELLDVGPDELGKLFNRLYEKSVKDRQIQVKNQQKSLEYNERAKREYMNPLILEKWAESTQQEIDSKKALIYEKYQKDHALKLQLARIKDFKANYMTEETTKAKLVYDKIYADWSEKIKSHYKEEIIAAARKKKDEEAKARAAAEKMRKDEEERKKKADENKKREEERLNEERKGKFTRAEPKSNPFGAAKPAFGAGPPRVIQRSDNPGTSFAGGFRRNVDPVPVVEEKKAEPAPTTAPAGPKRFINTNKRKGKEEEKDSEGFTAVTKESSHHK
jgi:translation initiation factor 3 subunit A